MRILGDVLLFLSTSLVLSITILCFIIQAAARDDNSRMFLFVMVPLTLQLGIVTLSSYLSRMLPAETLAGDWYQSFSLLLTIISIALTSMILYSVSLYVMRIGRDHFHRWIRRIRTWVLIPLTLFFLIISLFGVLHATQGDLAGAVSLTFKYYSSWSILFLMPHVVAASVLLSRVTDRELQSHLRGIVFAFAPIAVAVPLDVIYFRDHFFKLAYLCLAMFSLVVFWHLNKTFGREYLGSPRTNGDAGEAFARFGLSPREQEIAMVLIQGMTNAEMARELFISENTVRSHIKSIYRKADVSNRVQLIHKLRVGSSAE